jgi:hypothetical protein
MKKGKHQDTPEEGGRNEGASSNTHTPATARALPVSSLISMTTSIVGGRRRGSGIKQSWVQISALLLTSCGNCEMFFQPMKSCGLYVTYMAVE